jgi:hypothetical protein
MLYGLDLKEHPQFGRFVPAVRSHGQRTRSTFLNAAPDCFSVVSRSFKRTSQEIGQSNTARIQYD